MPVPQRRNPFFALLFVLILGISAPVLAQTAPATGSIVRLSPEDAERGLNGRQKNFWFKADGSAEYQDAGFFGQKLRPYLAGHTEALDRLNAYRRQKWLFLAERLVFVGAAGVYGQQILATDKPQYFNNTQKAAIGVAVGSLLANVLITRNTNQHFIRAVESHNSAFPAARRAGLNSLAPTHFGVTAPTGQPQLLVGWTLR